MSSIFASPFFSSTPSTQSPSFHPLFRLLDDYETHNHSRSTNNTQHDSRQPRLVMKSFTPKFDVKETVDAYELHGDFPGIEQKDIEIEFTDAQTLTIKGRTERAYTAGTPAAGFVEDAPAHAQGAIEEGKSTTSNNNNGHKATVEDEDVATETKSATSTEVATKSAHEEQPKVPVAKYWVSERSVGEFSRSFSFPVRVDTDKVTASMKNGVLAIVVPKAKKQESRKITIGN